MIDGFYGLAFFFYLFPAITISDPFFSGNQSSWMSFAPMNLRHRTVIEMQFQTRSPEGVLVYVAQRLSSKAGKGGFYIYMHFPPARLDLLSGALIVYESSQPQLGILMATRPVICMRYERYQDKQPCQHHLP